MRYSFEFKMECIKLYRQGRYPETPEGISDKRFHKYIITLSKMFDTFLGNIFILN